MNAKLVAASVVEPTDDRLGECHLIVHCDEKPAFDLHELVPCAVPFVRRNGDKRVLVSMFVCREWSTLGSGRYTMILDATGKPDIITTPLPFVIHFPKQTESPE